MSCIPAAHLIVYLVTAQMYEMIGECGEYLGEQCEHKVPRVWIRHVRQILYAEWFAVRVVALG